MNTQTQEALKMAIEFIEMHLTTNDRTFIERTATLQACKEALAEAEKQEPVLVISHDPNCEMMNRKFAKIIGIDGQEIDVAIIPVCDCGGNKAIQLYTHPATWQSLSSDALRLKHKIVTMRKIHGELLNIVTEYYRELDMAEMDMSNFAHKQLVELTDKLRDKVEQALKEKNNAHD